MASVYVNPTRWPTACRTRPNICTASCKPLAQLDTDCTHTCSTATHTHPRPHTHTRVHRGTPPAHAARRSRGSRLHSMQHTPAQDHQHTHHHTPPAHTLVSPWPRSAAARSLSSLRPRACRRRPTKTRPHAPARVQRALSPVHHTKDYFVTRWKPDFVMHDTDMFRHPLLSLRSANGAKCWPDSSFGSRQSRDSKAQQPNHYTQLNHHHTHVKSKSNISLTHV